MYMYVSVTVSMSCMNVSCLSSDLETGHFQQWCILKCSNDNEGYAGKYSNDTNANKPQECKSTHTFNENTNKYLEM